MKGQRKIFLAVTFIACATLLLISNAHAQNGCGFRGDDFICGGGGKAGAPGQYNPTTRKPLFKPLTGGTAPVPQLPPIEPAPNKYTVEQLTERSKKLVNTIENMPEALQKQALKILEGMTFDEYMNLDLPILATKNGTQYFLGKPLTAACSKTTGGPATVANIWPDLDGLNVIEVKPNQSIGAAVNKAPCGSVVKVYPGTYKESFKISGKKCSASKPLQIISVDANGQPKAGTAEIRGKSGTTVVQAGGQSSNFGIYGFKIVVDSGAGSANAGNDNGGFKFYGGVSNAVVAGNYVTTAAGKTAIDGIKMADDTTNFAIIGNVIDGNILESGIDLVAVHGGTVAYNTIKGTTGTNAATLGKDGSNDVIAHNNLFASNGVGGSGCVWIGGHGASRIKRRANEPNYASMRANGYEATNFNVYDNVIDCEGQKQVIFAGGQNSTLANNYIDGYIAEKISNSKPHKFASFNNTMTNNVITASNPLQTDGGTGANNKKNGSGSTISGTKKNGAKPKAGAAAFPQGGVAVTSSGGVQCGG